MEPTVDRRTRDHGSAHATRVGRRAVDDWDVGGTIVSSRLATVTDKAIDPTEFDRAGETGALSPRPVSHTPISHTPIPQPPSSLLHRLRAGEFYDPTIDAHAFDDRSESAPKLAARGREWSTDAPPAVSSSAGTLPSATHATAAGVYSSVRRKRVAEVARITPRRVSADSSGRDLGALDQLLVDYVRRR